MIAPTTAPGSVVQLAGQMAAQLHGMRAAVVIIISGGPTVPVALNPETGISYYIGSVYGSDNKPSLYLGAACSGTQAVVINDTDHLYYAVEAELEDDGLQSISVSDSPVVDMSELGSTPTILCDTDSRRYGLHCENGSDGKPSLYLSDTPI